MRGPHQSVGGLIEIKAKRISLSLSDSLELHQTFLAFGLRLQSTPSASMVPNKVLGLELEPYYQLPGASSLGFSAFVCVSRLFIM